MQSVRRSTKFFCCIAAALFGTALVGAQTRMTRSSCHALVAQEGGSSEDFKLRGPMGVIQLPRRPVKAPKKVRAFLPPDAEVRLLQRLTLNHQDVLVVYDRPEPGEANDPIEIRYPGVLVLRENHIVGRFSLKARTNDDADWVFLEASEVPLSGPNAGIALAFRSVGDGSGSLFLVISPDQGRYRIILKKVATQGRLRADQDGNLELWDANDGGECIWCRHQYTVLAYQWDGSHFLQVRKTSSCRQLGPDAMTDKPIELITQPLDVQYAEAQQKSKNHRGTCDSRDPTRIRPAGSRGTTATNL